MFQVEALKQVLALKEAKSGLDSFRWGLYICIYISSFMYETKCFVNTI